jgi:hypothetical protein
MESNVLSMGRKKQKRKVGRTNVAEIEDAAPRLSGWAVARVDVSSSRGGPNGAGLAFLLAEELSVDELVGRALCTSVEPRKIEWIEVSERIGEEMEERKRGRKEVDVRSKMSKEEGSREEAIEEEEASRRRPIRQ